MTHSPLPGPRILLLLLVLVLLATPVSSIPLGYGAEERGDRYDRGDSAQGRRLIVKHLANTTVTGAPHSPPLRDAEDISMEYAGNCFLRDRDKRMVCTPDIMLVGASKAGSSSLNKYLEQHPRIVNVMASTGSHESHEFDVYDRAKVSGACVCVCVCVLYPYILPVLTLTHTPKLNSNITTTTDNLGLTRRR
jgi:hypothetical protein